MPCNMMEGYVHVPGLHEAEEKIKNLERQRRDESRAAASREHELKQRIASLEEAFCGLLKSLGPPGEGTTYSEEGLRRWWENHTRQPGHKP